MPHNTRSLAQFVHNLTFDMLGQRHVDRLKQSLLESLGAAIAAFDEPVLRSLRVHVKDFNSSGPCSLIGGVRCAPDMAAYHNSGLVGFLDMNDVYFGARTTTCPSDAIPALVATFEYNSGSGEELLTAMAASYTTQVMLNKFDQDMEDGEDKFSSRQTALGTAAGVSKALSLDVERMVNGFNMALATGSCPNPVADGNMSDWMHMMRPNAVRHGVESAFLCMRGIGGVKHELEGEDRTPDLLKRYENLKINISHLDVINEVSSRKYSANEYAQSAIEAAIHIRHLYDFSPQQIESVHVGTLGICHRQLAGGNGKDCVDIVSREEAANSLPFLVAAALLHGTLDDSHFTHRSIREKEMQALRAQIVVKHDPEVDASYPEQLCNTITVNLKDGTTHTLKKCGYLGHRANPMSWDQVESRFHNSAKLFANDQLRKEIVDTVKNIESHRVDKLTSLLARVAPV